MAKADSKAKAAAGGKGGAKKAAAPKAKAKKPAAAAPKPKGGVEKKKTGEQPLLHASVPGHAQLGRRLLVLASVPGHAQLGRGGRVGRLRAAAGVQLRAGRMRTQCTPPPWHAHFGLAAVHWGMLCCRCMPAAPASW
jgi:hypothetical protein